jgi:hypothetical protein
VLDEDVAAAVERLAERRRASAEVPEKSPDEVKQRKLRT